MKKDKCAVCNKTVSIKHKAVCCDICNQWIHIKCNFIDNKTYQNLQDSNDEWYCLNCNKTIFPFSNIDNQHLYLNNNGKDISHYNHQIKLLPDEGIQELIEKANKITYNNEGVPEAIKINSKSYNIEDFNNIKYDKKNSFSTLHINIESINYHIDD